MEKILNFSYENKNEVINFLNKVMNYEDIDENILKNASILKEENSIRAIVSFEEIEKNGIIRYFVFDKNISNKAIETLLTNLYNIAKTKINNLFSVVDSSNIKELFINLGFKEINNENIIKDENLSQFNMSSLLIKKVS